jgi:hypothetical protein
MSLEKETMVVLHISCVKEIILLTPHLNRAASIFIISDRASHTAYTRLILTNTIYKVVVISAEFLGAVVTHPGTSRPLTHTERNTGRSHGSNNMRTGMYIVMTT